MSERTRIIIAIILLIVLVSAIFYELKVKRASEEPVVLTPTETVPVMDDPTVRSSRSYRLEDNLSVPSERTVEE